RPISATMTTTTTARTTAAGSRGMGEALCDFFREHEHEEEECERGEGPRVPLRLYTRAARAAAVVGVDHRAVVGVGRVFRLEALRAGGACEQRAGRGEGGVAGVEGERRALSGLVGDRFVGGVAVAAGDFGERDPLVAEQGGERARRKAVGVEVVRDQT